MSAPQTNVRPAPDPVLVEIADYVLDVEIGSALALDTARYCLLDTLGCGLEALSYPACTKLLGPLVPGTQVPHGARVPGTSLELDPVKAAFDIGTTIRWLDFNDTWLAAEWGHPSDNLGGILATADWLSRTAVAAGKPPLTMREVLVAMVKAHEIQGCLALENAFNRVGLDHVLLVKVASTAVVGKLLGLTRDELVNALSLAFVDGQALRTYRHAPNTGSRKSWAAGDATSRAVRLALIARTGEMGYPTALSAPVWGFYDVLFEGKPFRFQRPYGSYVMENVLFKIAFPPNSTHRPPPRRRSCCIAGSPRRAAAPRRSGASRSARTRPRSGSSTRPGRSRTPPTATTASSTWLPCRCCSGASPPPTTRTTSRPIRASTRCAPRSPASRTRSSRAIITTRTSARSPTD